MVNNKITLDDLKKAMKLVREKRETIKVNSTAYIEGILELYDANKHDCYYIIDKHTKQVIAMGISDKQAKLIKETFFDRPNILDISIKKFCGVPIVESKCQ